MATEATVGGVGISRRDLELVQVDIDKNPDRYGIDAPTRAGLVAMLATLAFSPVDENGKPINSRLRIRAADSLRKLDELNLKYSPPVKTRVNISATAGTAARREALRDMLAAEMERRGIVQAVEASDVQRTLEVKRSAVLAERLAELESGDPVLAAPETVDLEPVRVETVEPDHSGGFVGTTGVVELPPEIAELYQ